MSAAAEILGAGAVTPVGLHLEATAAAIRAGLDRKAESAVYNKALEPQVLSLVPDELLWPEGRTLEPVGPAAPVRGRLLRLGAEALAHAAEPATRAAAGAPLPLILALPDHAEPGPDDVALAAELGARAGVKLRAPARAVRQGPAGGLVAVQEAMALLAAGRGPLVLAGGVDTFLDPERLEALDADDRLLGSTVGDGFIPGEGAAFLLLAAPGTARRLGAEPLGTVAAVGVGAELGHRGAAEPYRGEGLAEAFRELFAAAPARLPAVGCVYAGFNGENLPAKEWGVAFLRNAERFARGLQIEHPADCLGDVGAATGPVMIALAALGMRRGWVHGPSLVWCTSDRAPRAACIVV